MSDPIGLIRRWLEILAAGTIGAWSEVVAAEALFRFPYAPSGMDPRSVDEARAAIGAFWTNIQSFEWNDVVIRGTEDPQLFLTIARSEALTASGSRYANDYVMLTRIRNGRIVEHVEYFNPLVVQQLFAKP